MMDEVTKQALLSAVRSLAIVAGSSLVAHGYLNTDAMNETIGAFVVIIPILWGVVDKYSAERKTKTREAVAVNVGIKVADSTVGLTPLVTATAAPEIINAIAPTLPAGSIEPAITEVQPTKGSP